MSVDRLFIEFFRDLADSCRNIVFVKLAVDNEIENTVVYILLEIGALYFSAAELICFFYYLIGIISENEVILAEV